MKELIISANVHEKKVAILDDGVVTEFYVERGDENQGVVGNLYKGRVMKVLPGMQSAFVDIALERDAFLYVSDFAELMEDEDILEYRTGVTAEPRADTRQPPEQRGDPRQGGPRPRRDDRRDSDFQRRRQQFSRPGQPPPITEAVVEPIVAEPSEPRERPREESMYQQVVEQLAELTDESVIEPPREEEMEGIMNLQPPPEPEDLPFIEPPEVSSEPEEEVFAAAEVTVEEEIEEEPRSKRRGRTTGKKPSAVKADARKRAAKGRVAAERRVPREESTDESGFERVTDDYDNQETGEMLKDAMVQEKIIDRVQIEEFRPITGDVDQPVAKVGSLRSKMVADPRFQRVSDEDEAARLRAARAAEQQESEYQRHAPRYEERSADESSYVVTERSYEQERGERDDTAQTSDAEVIRMRPDEEPDSREDREAEIRDRGDRSEFAIRRGGRGRRRRREPQPGPEEEKPRDPAAEPEGEEPAAGEETVEIASAVQEVLPEQPQPQPQQQQRPPMGEQRGRGGPEHQRRNQYPGSQGGQGGPDRPSGGPGAGPNRQNRRPDRPAPTISELLREGQEILVQIAKEPIAKKGARITSHIALPGRYLVYMPTVNHVGVSRKIGSDMERVRLKRTVTALRDREAAGGGFIVRTACEGHTEQELQDDMRYLLRTWGDIKKKAERVKSPALVHRDLDLVQRILRDHLSEEFNAIRVDNEVEYARLVEFVNRIQPKLVKRVKLFVGDQPILEKYGVQQEIDKALKPRVWLKSGGYIVINQTEALVAIDVNTGKFVGKSDRLEDTITRTNLEAVKEIVRQIRLRDLGGIIVLDLIDMEERKNRQRVMAALQQELQADRAPSKILSINDFGLVAITRKRVKQSLERTLCSPCPYCQGAGLVKSSQTMCFEILEQTKAIAKQAGRANDVTLRVSPDVADALRSKERDVFEEIEAYFSVPVTIESDPNLHREQFDFAIV